MTATREKYAGVLSILEYNVSYYAASLFLLISVGLLVALMRLPRTVEFLVIAAAGIAAFWSLSSLLASYYIYDYVGVTRWNWIPRVIPTTPRRWLNIHAGLDQSSLKLAALFPKTEHLTLDIYDPVEMTEPSIARARRAQGVSEPAGNATLDALPLPDKDRDAVFLLFAAHEIRQRARRVKFLAEVCRVLFDSGEVLLVEHLRDWKNFIAFGPGFLHFFSREDWAQVVQAAGFKITLEDRVTPMIRYFVMKKLDA